MNQPIQLHVRLTREDLAVVAQVMYESVRSLKTALKVPEHIGPSWQFAPASVQHDCTVIVHRVASGQVKSGGDIHAQWRDEQYRMGWRQAGEADHDHMRSPDICDFRELPPEKQARYHLMFAVAENVLANLALIAAFRRTNLYAPPNQ